MDQDRLIKLGELVLKMKWHWSLEKCSQGSLGELWCIYDTDTGETLSGAETPEDAITNALTKPLTEAQQKYYPRYAWGFMYGENNT